MPPAKNKKLKNTLKFNGEFDLDDDLNDIIEEFDRYNGLINDNLNKLKFEAKHNTYKDLYEKNVADCKKLENESINLIEKIRDTYENNILKIKKSYEEQFLVLIEKHQNEIENSKLMCNCSSKTSNDNKNYKKDQVQQLKQEIIDLKKNLEASKAKVNEQEKNMKKLEEEYKMIKSENLDNVKTINKYERKITELEQINRGINYDLEEIKKNGQTFHETIGSEKTDIDNLEFQSMKRKLNQKIEVCRILREELHDVKQTLKKYETLVDEEKDKNVQNSNLISSYKNEIESSKMMIDNKDSEIMNLRLQIDQHNNSLKMKLKDLSMSEEKWMKKANTFSVKNEHLLKEIEDCKRKNVELKYLLDKGNAEVTRHENDKQRLERFNKKLRTMYEELEQELKQYAIKVPTLINKHKTYSNDEISSLNRQLEEANKKIDQLMNEKEELNSKLDSLSSKNAIQNENNIIEYNKLRDNLEIEMDENRRLQERIDRLEEIVQDKEYQVQQSYNNKEKELIMIKEEASGHITKICILESELSNIKNRLDLFEKENRKLRHENVSLQNEMEYQQKEMQKQHKKLFEFISAKDKKKSIFQPIINKFNSENNNTPKKQDDFEKLWKEEKEKNSLLKEQINLYIEDYSQSCQDVENLKSQIVKLHTQNFTDDENYDNEHRFIPITAGPNTVCVSCAKYIMIGTKAKKCQSCESIIHCKCDLYNNCGLSLEQLREKRFGDFDDSSSEYSEFSVEPSAPERLSG